MTEYAVTLAWRDLDSGDLEPEFVRTVVASTADEAVEIVTSA